MARPLRLEFAGALYHITSRGDRREAIYENDDDRENFLSILGDVCETYRWSCYAYCLMGNHYHLLIETRDGNLSRGMRQLNGVYTQRHNHSHKRVGHVFQGRYKAILIDKDSYLLEVARYIVLNPVRARMVRTAQDWPWSSYRDTVGLRPSQSWLFVDRLLSAFGTRKAEAVAAYKQFVTEGKGQPSPWESLRHQVYLGDEQFVQQMLLKIDGDRELSEIPATQRRGVPKSLAEYESLATNRDNAIASAYASGGYSMRTIGDYFGLHYSRVSRIVGKAKGKT